MLRINFTNFVSLLSFNDKSIEIDIRIDSGAKYPNLNQSRKLLKAYEVAMRTGNPPAIPIHLVRNLGLKNNNIAASFGYEYTEFPDFVITEKDCGL